MIRLLQHSSRIMAHNFFNFYILLWDFFVCFFFQKQQKYQIFFQLNRWPWKGGYCVLRTTYRKRPTFTSIFPVLPHHNMEAIFSIPFTVLEVPNLKLKRPGWVKQPSAMVMFSMVLFSYFLVTGGKVFEHVSISVCRRAGRHALGLPGITIFQRACIVLRDYLLSTGNSHECWMHFRNKCSLLNWCNCHKKYFKKTRCCAKSDYSYIKKLNLSIINLNYILGIYHT